MDEKPSAFVPPPDKVTQVNAILGPDIFKWAVGLLSEGVSIEDVRYRDLIDVSEEDVLTHVRQHGFDGRVVSEDRVVDDRTCIVKEPGGWTVFYTERGSRSDEATFTRRDEAVREVVRRLMRLARVMLNHRYWHAHDLPFPCNED